MKTILTILTLMTTGCLAIALVTAQSRSAADQYQEALRLEEVKGDLEAAIEQYQTLAQGSDRAIAARALVRMAASYEKLGRPEARPVYERVVRDFAEQAESAAAARARLAALQTTSPPGQTTRLIWSHRRLSTGEPGSISDDGRYTTFSDLSLTLVDLEEGRTKTFSPASLGSEYGWVEGSAISPDGRQVAYVLAVQKPGEGDDRRTHEIRVLQVSGGDAGKSRGIPYPDPTANFYLLGWSPDGKEVLIVRFDFVNLTDEPALVSIADGAVRVLPKVQRRCCTRHRMSPDGRFIAYSSNTGSATDGLFVVTRDGKETRINVGPGQNRNPIWARDGSHILFESDRTGKWSLWVAPVVGGTPSGPARLVKEDVPGFFPLGFTRNGAFYYLGGRGSSNVYTAELDARQHVVGGPLMATDQFINSNSAGSWSADGQHLAYLSRTPRGVFIRVRSVKTSEDREVPSRIPITGPVRWFPDGQSLLVASRDARILNGDLGYYRMNIASGDAQLLHQTASREITATRPDLSPDGRTIFYLETLTQPVRFDIDSRRATRLTPVGARRVALAISPDGSQVAYLGTGGDSPEADVSRAALVVAPATGGEPRAVANFVGNSTARERNEGLGLAWSPDQRYLFFVRPEGDTGDGSKAVWRVPLDRGEAENLRISMDRIRALRVHPDGRRIAFDSVVDPRSEVWALENYLPRPAESK
jgi:Tol biopolymer transport system component